MVSAVCVQVCVRSHGGDPFHKKGKVPGWSRGAFRRQSWGQEALSGSHAAVLSRPTNGALSGFRFSRLLSGSWAQYECRPVSKMTLCHLKYQQKERRTDQKSAMQIPPAAPVDPDSLFTRHKRTRMRSDSGPFEIK